jgi:TonB-linked SusC/RagA family outer membrane protein
MPAYEEDGSYAGFEDYQANWLSDNPVKSAKEIRAFTNGYRALGTLAGEYKFSNKLYFKSSLSADVNFNFDTQFKSPLTADAEAFGGASYEGNFRNVTWLNENTLHYSDTKNGNTLSLLGGVTMQRTQIDRSSALGQGFPPGALERISSAANIINATSEGTSFALLSFLSRINYDVKNRFLFTFTSRADGSSRFSKNNRFGFFPSGAVAWRISKEPFFNGLKQVFSDFKIRMSAGLTGDQEIGDFQNITFYTASRYAGRSGYQLRNLADPDLTWQTNSMFNIGLDYEMADGKIGGSLEFFNSLKSNLLSEDLIPATTGFTSITRNGGEVQNVGLEFNINASLAKKEKFTWDVNFNATWIHNEIKSLNSDGVYLNAYDDLEATHILQIGHPVGSFLGLKYLGVDPETGDVQFEDFNEDGNIDYDDAQIIGKAMPDLYGGLTNVFKWKNLDFSIFSRFSLGNQVYNLIRGTTENLGWSNDGGLSSIYANNTLNVRDRWKKPGDEAEYGRASFINLNLGLNSSQMVENASFFRIQNINAGYSLPSPKKFSSVRIYAEVQNLWILTSYKGFDPEVSSNGGLADRTAGVDYGAYPSARTFLMGLSLKF